MELTILERLLLLNNLPKEGSVHLLRVRQDLIGKLGLTADELVTFTVTTNDGKVTWRVDIPQDTQVPLGEAEIGLLKDQLRKMDHEGRMVPDLLGLWDKLIDGKGGG